MKHIIRAAALIGALALAATTELRAEITPLVTLRSSVAVEGAVVRLGDLFDGLTEKAGVPVARAPNVGTQVQLDARWLAAVAQRYGVAWRPTTLLDHAVVERASRVISSDQIERQILAELQRRGQPADLEIQLDNPALSIRLPKELEATIEIVGLSYDQSGGRFVVQLAAPSREQPIAQSTVSGRAMTMTEVPTLGRQIVPGEAILAADVDWVRMPSDRIGRGVILELDRLVGMTPRRPLRIGEPLRSRDLRQPVVVPKNSLVSLIYETERMRLTAQGKALEDGALGEVIRIMNTKSNSIINAVVEAPGLVNVQPASIAALSQE